MLSYQFSLELPRTIWLFDCPSVVIIYADVPLNLQIKRRSDFTNSLKVKTFYALCLIRNFRHSNYAIFSANSSVNKLDDNKKSFHSHRAVSIVIRSFYERNQRDNSADCFIVVWRGFRFSFIHSLNVRSLLRRRQKKNSTTNNSKAEAWRIYRSFSNNSHWIIDNAITGTKAARKPSPVVSIISSHLITHSSYYSTQHFQHEKDKIVAFGKAQNDFCHCSRLEIVHNFQSTLRFHPNYVIKPSVRSLKHGRETSGK